MTDGRLVWGRTARVLTSGALLALAACLLVGGMERHSTVFADEGAAKEDASTKALDQLRAECADLRRELLRVDNDLFVTKEQLRDGFKALEGMRKSVDELRAVVPVGGVIAWWGDVASIPDGFELCDGRVPTTSGAKLSGPKPDLLGRFPRGASATCRRVSGLERGGTDEHAAGKTDGHALAVAEMPSHDHSVRDPGHTHGINDPGHSHGIPMGDGDGDPRDRCADGEGRERKPVRTTHDGTGITVKAAKSGLSVLPAGEGKAHAHGLPRLDNRPAYQELFFIIRVS